MHNAPPPFGHHYSHYSIETASNYSIEGASESKRVRVDSGTPALTAPRLKSTVPALLSVEHSTNAPRNSRTKTIAYVTGDGEPNLRQSAHASQSIQIGSSQMVFISSPCLPIAGGSQEAPLIRKRAILITRANLHNADTAQLHEPSRLWHPPGSNGGSDGGPVARQQTSRIQPHWPSQLRMSPQMTYKQKQTSRRRRRGTFIDLFAGCGGLSLGLMAAGWEGLFAVEQDSIAFETLNHNLIAGHSHSLYRYSWPEWLEQSPMEISDFLVRNKQRLKAMKGRVDLLAGGPPCQGFSFAGRRRHGDPRNKLFKHYVSTVRSLRPKFLLLENVRGISVSFRSTAHNGRPASKSRQSMPFSDQIEQSLRKIGYRMFSRLIHGKDAGVPQLRPRYIFLGVRNDLLPRSKAFDPFATLQEDLCDFLESKGIPAGRAITVQQAISDLETAGRPLIECEDSPGFDQLRYNRPLSFYQKLLHTDLNGTAPNSLRLVKHTPLVATRFRRIIATCRQGVSMSPEDKARFGIKKHSVVPLHPHRPSHTLTTLPDDLIHYSEPRILTVRECARLQSFPDWYAFKGKYTTGGHRRKRECPRYTQVGNAVPPLVAELLGNIIHGISTRLKVHGTY